MSDEADLADMQQQKLLDATIENAQRRANFSIEGSGVCVVCDSVVKPVIVNNRSIIGRFCSIECRDRYE